MLYVAAGMSASALLPQSAAKAAEDTDGSYEPKVTDKVFFDIKIGDKLPVRVVLGLFGQEAPGIVTTFKALCRAEPGLLSYKRSLIHRIINGTLAEGGRIRAPFSAAESSTPPFQLSPDFLSSSSFRVQHDRAGILSTANYLEEDTDRSGYEFLITMGPYAALDGQEIAFGRVLEGLDVIYSLNAIKTLKPNPSKEFFLEVGKQLGDERAVQAGASLYKPLVKVVIADAGVI